jgi:hypothetical protein
MNDKIIRTNSGSYDPATGPGAAWNNLSSRRRFLKQSGGAALGVAVFGNLSTRISLAQASGSAPVKVNRVEYRHVTQESSLTLTPGIPAPGTAGYAAYQDWLNASETAARDAEATATGGAAASPTGFPGAAARTVITENKELHANPHTGFSQDSLREIEYLDPFGNVTLYPEQVTGSCTVILTIHVHTTFFYND